MGRLLPGNSGTDAPPPPPPLACTCWASVAASRAMGAGVGWEGAPPDKTWGPPSVTSDEDDPPEARLGVNLEGREGGGRGGGLDIEG